MSSDSSNSSGDNGAGLGLAPPLLPAFLITGFFIAVAVTLLTWRHFRWQAQDQARRRAGLLRRGDTMVNKRVPKLWDVWVDGENVKSLQSNDWRTVMPLSAIPFTKFEEDALPQAGKSVLPYKGTHQLQVACVVSMPQTSHPKHRHSSDTSMTNRNEYAIGIAVCESPRSVEPVKKVQVKQRVESPSCLV